jgi:hypothetical protein
MKLWSVPHDDSLGLDAHPVEPSIVRGMAALWMGHDPATPPAASASRFLVGLRDQLRHLVCGCRGDDVTRGPRLLCKRIESTGTTFLSLDPSRAEHALSCVFYREAWENPDRPNLLPATRTARDFELAALFLGIGGQVATRRPGTSLPPRRSDTHSDGSSKAPSIATALDLMLEASEQNRAWVPYPRTSAGLRVFPESLLANALARIENPTAAGRHLGQICLVQPLQLDGAVVEAYETARRAWVGSRSPVGYLVFVCEDLISSRNETCVRYRCHDNSTVEVLLPFRIPCARDNVAGPYLVLCRVGRPAHGGDPVILEATSQAVAAYSDWWAVDSNWERPSYQNLRRVLKAAADEGLHIEAWRPMRWLTALKGGLFLPDYWLRCRSSWDCWHNLFVEVEGNRNSAGREMKERTVERAGTRGHVWREDRRDGMRERADRAQRNKILTWARWAREAPPQADSDAV